MLRTMLAGTTPYAGGKKHGRPAMIDETERLGKGQCLNHGADECRLCGGAVVAKFCLTILRKHRVMYYRCENCESLQTELPYWLDDAHASRALAKLDTGAAQRSMQNLAVSLSISRLLNLKNAIDYGGGDGLLCRLLRDYGINWYVRDKYAQVTYAQGSTEPEFGQTDLLLCFEVFEHFARPAADSALVFSFEPHVLIASTLCYSGHGEDWWYLTPESGQHVFFYGHKAVRLIAEKFGYGLIIGGNYLVFLKPNMLKPLTSLWIRLCLRETNLRYLRAGIQMLTARGVWPDHWEMKRK
jgi:hypothetical protein